jgi:hypothetical protein
LARRGVVSSCTAVVIAADVDEEAKVEQRLSIPPTMRVAFYHPLTRERANISDMRISVPI